MKDFKDYKRFPIQLSSQHLMLIHLYNDIHTGSAMIHTIENVDLQETIDAVWDWNINVNEISAKQFFDQLEGHYCDAFLKELILEATRRLNSHDIKRKEFSDKTNKTTCTEVSRAAKALKEAEKLITE